MRTEQPGKTPRPCARSECRGGARETEGTSSEDTKDREGARSDAAPSPSRSARPSSLTLFSVPTPSFSKSSPKF